jgi:ankyrin repeat protein
MKRLLPISTLLLILSVTGCGKKAHVSDEDTGVKTDAPSVEADYLNSLREIHRCVTKNDLKGLQRAVAENPSVDLNQILHNGETFLIMAIKSNFIEIRNFLIEKDVSIEKPSVNLETPLMAAVDNGHINTVRVLLDLKVNLEKTDNKGNTALHLAIKKEFDPIALLLVNRGAAINAKDKEQHSAIDLSELYKVPLTQRLLKSFLQIESGSPDVVSFRTLLTTADHEKLSMVLHRYPNIVTDYESINPLALLVEAEDSNNAIRSAEFLIKHSANVDGPKDAETTPLIQAIVSKKQSFTNLYLNNRANPQLLDKDGKSALIHAIELNQPEIVSLLLANSAVETYTLRKDGKKITYDACKVARGVLEKLTTPEDKLLNKKIQENLNCGFLNWLFEAKDWNQK